MDLDSLAREIAATSSEPVVQGLSTLLRDWKSNERTVEELRESIERYIGGSWIAKSGDHARVYGLWSDFRDQAIVPIGGMTMNERLYWFGLTASFDACDDDASRARLYRKLLASP